MKNMSNYKYAALTPSFACVYRSNTWNYRNASKCFKCGRVRTNNGAGFNG